ncbi:MAG: MarR family transcriptional regulator [Halomonadaceae bacterium]|nr:MAG: MarR family transcriptional regulator [Halomonadaceae bacterium]
MALTEMDRYWGEILGDPAFYDLNYSDLFTRMWMQQDRWFRKTELYELMPKVSPRTAVKYVQKAITSGVLLEKPDKDDMRCKRIAMSPELVTRIEDFIDHALATFEQGPFAKSGKGK